jgi:hypothetical protein
LLVPQPLAINFVESDLFFVFRLFLAIFCYFGANMEQNNIKKPKRQQNMLEREFPEARGGVIMITCIKNRKTYLGRSRDVEWLLWYIKKKLRYGIWRNKAMQEDYNQYGLQWFRFGVASAYLKREAEDEKGFWRRIESDWIELRANMNPEYNLEKYRGQRFHIRQDLNRLGRGRISAETMQYKSAGGLRGIFVITCTKNQRQYVGQAKNLHRTIKKNSLALQKGAHVNPLMQADFNQYGRECFATEFCEVPDGDLREARAHVIERINPYYTVVTEQERGQKSGASRMNKGKE